MTQEKPPFRPVLETEGINNPESKPLFELAYLLAGAAGIFGLLFLGAGWIGEQVAVRLSPATERSWFGGVNFAKADGADKSHAGMQKLLEEMFPEDGKFLRVQLTCDDMVNAFAVPGGSIHVTGKLLEAVPSKGGVAFVLGHEVGHFRNRDHLRGLGRAMAGMMVANLLGFGEAPALNRELLQGLVERSFSRNQESSADAVAMEVMEKRYGSLTGAEQLFTKLKDVDGGAHRIPALLSTHPHPDSRIEVIRAKANTLKDSPELKEPHGFVGCPAKI